SPIWFVLNPFWNTVHAYLWYLFAWEFAFVGIMYFLHKHHRISMNVIYWYMITCLFLTLDHNPQSIVAMSFVFLIPAFGPLALIPAAIIKFPIGWSWNFTDEHWKCAFGNSSFVLQDWLVPCNHIKGFDYWLQYPTLFYNWFTYGFIAIMLIWNLMTWKNTTVRAIVAKILLKTGLFYPLRIIALQRLHLFERGVVQIIKTSKGDIFIDIGSANGYYAKLARPNFKQVWTVDPNPKFKVHFPYAFGQESMTLGEYRAITYDDPKTAWIQRFDNVFTYADLVKIDVEGAEFEVLKGMSGSNVRAVIVELHDLARRAELKQLMET